MQPLVDFLNHGVLPFAGRSRELDRITSFWQGISESHGLRAMLLSGEAGIGKSRLLEESMRRIIHAGGAVVHARLYPDGSASLAPLLAHSIWASGAGRRLLQQEPEPTVGSIAAALRRMCRLRPTLVVFEDIHLLVGEPLTEFASLLGIISEETISILCVSRPLGDSIRSVLVRFLTGEIELAGLSSITVSEIWSALFNSLADSTILTALHQTTGGNALALRSALRGAVSSQAIADDREGKGWRVVVEPEMFRNGLERHVHLLFDGMAAHLTEQERNAAIDLAALGEIFSREAAAMTIAVADDMIEALMFKGLLTTSVTLSPPLFGHPDTQPPLAFTHSLIHRQLVPRSRSAACRVVSLLAADLPLYSAVPFTMLADCQEAFTSPADEVIAAVDNALSAAERLETTPDWQPGTVIWKGAWELLQRLKPELPAGDQLLLEARAIHIRLFFLKRDIAGEEHGEMAGRLFALTADPATPEIANYYLHALHHAVWKIARDTPDELSGQLRRAEAIFERFPELSESPAYIHLLQDIANVAATIGNYEAGREIDHKLSEIMASTEISEELRELAFKKISINLLWLFETPEELARRLAALEQLERVDPGNIGTMIWKITIFEQLGRFDEAVELADAAAPYFRSNGQIHFQLLGKLVPICANGGFGGSLTAIERESCRLLEKASPTVAARLQRNIGVRLSNIAILLGDADSSRRITTDYLNGEHPWGLHPLAAHIADNDLHEAVRMITELPDLFPPSIDTVGRMVAGDTPQTRLAALREAREIFASPPLRINDILIRLVLFDLIALLETEPAYAPFVGEIAHQFTAAIHDVLDWFGRHELWAYMSALLDRHGNRLKEEEREDWRGRTITIAIRRESAHTIATDGPLKISMLGSIEILMQNGETVHLRTGRLRTLLGLLVADCMVEGRLSQREFWEIVAGSEGSPERARKGTNLAVHRLREAIGHAAILTGHDTPRLNLELVEADLLEANAQLRECEEALNDDYLIRACPALLKALEITRGEVPFPGLYEEFFEAAREDFDYRLRRAVIETSGRLLHEGETEIAETILRRGFESLPGDDEIAELLQATLVRTGRHVEASRIRMKAVEAEAGIDL